MRRFEGRTAFVTGAASGIGLALSRALLDRGMNVVIADLNGAGLATATEELGATDRLSSVMLDVTDRAAFAAARDAALARFGAVHLLCNNAGVGGGAAIHDAAYEDWDWMMGINLGGVINGVVTFLPVLRQSDEAHILNTSSVAGLFMSPDAVFGIYSVSKIAVRSLSESLRWALAGSGVGVTALCPGYVRTGIAKTGRLHPAVAEGRRQPDLETEALVERMSAAIGMDPAEAARIALDAIERDLPYAITHPQFAPAAANYAGILADAFGEGSGPDDGSASHSITEVQAVREAERVRY